MPVGEMQVEGHIGLFYFLGAPAQGATFLGDCRGHLRFCLGPRVCTQRALRSIDILPSVTRLHWPWTLGYAEARLPVLAGLFGS